jgi:hypothetical protein
MNRYLFPMLGPLAGTLTAFFMSGPLYAMNFLFGALGLLFAVWLEDRS